MEEIDDELVDWLEETRVFALVKQELWLRKGEKKMKRTIAVLTALILAVALCGCQARTGFDAPQGASSSSDAPENGTETPSSSAASENEAKTSSPSASHESGQARVVDDRFVEEAVLGFGAKRATDDSGKELIVPQVVSLYYRDSLTAETLTPGDCYSWYYSYMLSEDITVEEREQKYAHPSGDDMGWFFPEDIYETVVMSRFEVTAELLRSDESYYDKELGGYRVFSGPGKGETPEIRLGAWSVSGHTVSIPLSIEYNLSKDMVLTVRLDDNGYKYVSYLPATE